MYSELGTVLHFFFDEKILQNLFVAVVAFLPLLSFPSFFSPKDGFKKNSEFHVVVWYIFYAKLRNQVRMDWIVFTCWYKYCDVMSIIP